jgi:hypothetical protein
MLQDEKHPETGHPPDCTCVQCNDERLERRRKENEREERGRRIRSAGGLLLKAAIALLIISGLFLPLISSFGGD